MAKRREPETARIESLTHDGRGIVATDGKKVFVSGALPDEEVRFQRRKRRRNFDEAELLEVIEPSVDRIEPRCEAFGICGGCSLQHVSPAYQRNMKQQTLADNLQRIGKVKPDSWLPPVYDESPDGAWNYRRRARLAVKDVMAKGRVLVGFRERHAPYVSDMHRCEVLEKPVDGLLDALSELIGSLSIRARLPQIEVAIAENVTSLIFRVLDEPTSADLEKFAAFAGEYEIHVGLQTGGPDSIKGLTDGSNTTALVYSLPDFNVDIEFTAVDFVQINATVNRQMVAQAVHLLQVDGDHRVLDLFCGIGNFSLPLARSAGHVLGMEMEARQVARARENAARNNIENCDFKVADLSQVDGHENWIGESWDRMLLDPARTGALEVVQLTPKIDVQRIVYVSCHPGTLARDSGVLVHDCGYRLESAGIIDMFPHTSHVESIAVFQKH